MNRSASLKVRGRAGPLAVAMALAVLVAGTAAGRPGAACLGVDGMTENFLTVYPTGGHAARFDGDRGRKVMQALATDSIGDEIVFLYSGDGPVTGARGRYMYLVLDPGDCLLDSDWIDGDAYDRAVTAE